MTQNQMQKRNVAVGTFAALMIAAASVSLVRAEDTVVPAGNTTSLRAGQALPTISVSGSTAMRNFTVSPNFTFLNPVVGNAITLGNAGSELTYSFGSSLTSLQLASGNVTANDTSSNQSALRVEWHEQGSVEGILEMVDGQISTGTYANTLYNPTSGNGTFVNRNRWGGTSGGTAVASGPSNASFNGFRLAAQSAGSVQDNLVGQSRVQMAISDVTTTQGFSKGGAAANNAGVRGATPNAAGYGKGNPALAGVGGANSRQQLVDVSMLNMAAGAANPSGGTFEAGPWNTGGIDNVTNKTVAVTATTFAANPGTGLTHVNRTDAQWLQTTGRLQNGVDFNVTSRDVNSGTRNVAALNTGVDPSWATGENDGGDGTLANAGTTQAIIGSGLTFSNKTAGGAQLRPVLERSRMSVGTISLSDIQARAQGNVAAPVRVLGYRDDIDDASNNNSGAGGFYSESGLNAGDPSANSFVLPSAQTITNGSYTIWQNETYVTVKTPNQAAVDAYIAAHPGATATSAWASISDAETGIKGDNTGKDVADVRNNVLNSVATRLTGPNVSSASPADGLLDNGFVLPQLMTVTKSLDGVGTATARTLSSDETAARGNFLDASFGFTPKFAVADPAAIKQGTGSTYGGNIGSYTDASNTATNIAPVGGSIAITANNYFFGDFNQSADGSTADANRKEVRDFRDLVAMQDAQAKLAASGLGVDWNANAGSNASTTGLAGLQAVNRLAFVPSKGDLITMGDFNSDGKFDGKDLYLFARGAAVANTGSNASTYTLSGGAAGFGDSIRSAGILRKNAALDFLSTTATAQQKIDASANLAVDPTGEFAFNKFDVNRDGRPNVYDLSILRTMAAANSGAGLSVASQDDQLGASALVTGNFAGPQGTRLIGLVDAELNDNGAINGADLALLQAAVRGDVSGDGRINAGDRVGFYTALRQMGTFSSALAAFPGVTVADLNLLGDFTGDNLLTSADITGFVARAGAFAGDYNLDGFVDAADYTVWADHFGQTGTAGTLFAFGDGNGDGVINAADYTVWADNFGGGVPMNLGGASVPEPMGVSLAMAPAAMLLGRRRR